MVRAILEAATPAAPVPQQVTRNSVVVPAMADDAWSERYCAAVNRHPDGGQATFVEGMWRHTSFREIARNEINTMIATAPAASAEGTGELEEFKQRWRTVSAALTGRADSDKAEVMRCLDGVLEAYMDKVCADHIAKSTRGQHD